MVCVVSKTGQPLMPTTEYKARKLLKKNKAEVYRHEPFFAIRLLERETGETMPVEYASDTGYLHVGISIKSDKHEYISEERILLEDEAERNRDRTVHRRERRSRLRYREPRFDNRKKKIPEGWEKWFPPSIRHKVETQVYLFEKACEVIPITSATFEMGMFDTQLLKALEEGKEPPQGTEYQQGPRYKSESLRQAVFCRDEYTCQCCGRSSFKDGALLHEHHIGYWKEDRTDRMDNLMTVCEKCHTTANHREGGKLYGLEPELKSFKGATFMTSVRFEMIRQLKEGHDFPIHMCYGAGTKCTRTERNIEKSHANDAYCIGEKHPKHRAHTEYYQKIRRNDRCKEEFYDAKYFDSRTGEKAKASELGCGRTKRNTHLEYEDQRQFRGKKKSNGHRSISWGNAPIRAGSVVEVTKTPRKKKGEDKKPETIHVYRTVTSVHRTLKNKKQLKEIQAGESHHIKAEDICWRVDLNKPLPDGVNSTSISNIKIIKQPIKHGWIKLKGGPHSSPPES